MMASAIDSLGVLIVDDSAFMRKLIAEMIDAQPGFRVAGFARDGADALVQVQRLQPAIVTLDLEMPKLDGLAVLQRIMAESPRPVIVLSAGGPQYGDATLRALELGAVEFVRKPSGPISLDLPVIRDRLVDALAAAARARIPLLPALAPMEPRAQRHVPDAAAASVTRAPARHVVVIASSTGGPRALAELIPLLPPSLGAAVVVAQHIPAEFTAALAHRLARTSSVYVCEADDGASVLEGVVYIARGGAHSTLAGTPGAATLHCHAAGSRSGVTPSADMLFESAAQVFGRDSTGVVLTGMGRDGAVGLKSIRAVGGHSIVQDEASSAIYGMPRAALIEAGADRVVSLAEMASAIVGMVPGERLKWLTA